MQYVISTPKREQAMRAEMQRRKSRLFLVARARAFLISPAFVAVLLIVCVLAASYGDTLSGINPQ